jgi:hypothetical protein
MVEYCENAGESASVQYLLDIDILQCAEKDCEETIGLLGSAIEKQTPGRE